MTHNNDNKINKIEPSQSEETSITCSSGLTSFLRNKRTSFALSAYHGQSLFFIGTKNHDLISVYNTANGKTLGMTVSPEGEIFTTTSHHIMRFANVQGPVSDDPNHSENHDKVYALRTLYLTGPIRAHDICYTKDHGVVFVVSSYNCVATLDPVLSFKPIWKPDFISKIVREDRCHLNGIASEDGVLRYATAYSATNTLEGWKSRGKNGGIIIDIEKNEIVCKGLSQPHTPRIHEGKLWVCNSGMGQIGTIDFDEKNLGKRFKPLYFCPGYIRGLDFIGSDHIVVGLSRPRGDHFDGLKLERALERADSDPWTGFQIINLSTGQVVDWLRIDGPLREIHSIITLKNTVMPMGMGLFDELTPKIVKAP